MRWMDGRGFRVAGVYNQHVDPAHGPIQADILFTQAPRGPRAPEPASRAGAGRPCDETPVQRACSQYRGRAEPADGRLPECGGLGFAIYVGVILLPGIRSTPAMLQSVRAGDISIGEASGGGLVIAVPVMLLGLLVFARHGAS